MITREELNGAIQLEILEQLKKQNEVKPDPICPREAKRAAYKKLLEPKPKTTFGNV